MAAASPTVSRGMAKFLFKSCTASCASEDPKGVPTEHAVPETQLAVGETPSRAISNSEKMQIAKLIQSEEEKLEIKKLQTMMTEEKDGYRKRWTEVSPFDDINFFGSVRLAQLQIKTATVLHSQLFVIFIGFLILLNAICIGVEQSLRLEQMDATMFEVSEYFFFSIFLLEVLMRFFVSGRHCLKCNWVKFDCVLIFIGVANMWVMYKAASDTMEPFMVLRAIRLLRLARTVKLVMHFRHLWMLVRGLLSSFGTMLSTLLLLLAVIFVFSSIGVEIITKHPLARGGSADPQFKALVDQHFSNLPLTMLTLLQFVCLDSIGSIYKPLVKMSPWLALYFVSIILIVSIVLMNLVTAVVVSSAFDRVSEDREAQIVYNNTRKQRLVKKLKDTFEKLDANGDGYIALDELKVGDEDELAELYRCLKLDNPEDIFRTLDVECTGRICIDEFCKGVLQAVTSESSIELHRMDKQLAAMKKTLVSVEKVQEEAVAVLRKMDLHILQLEPKFMSELPEDMKLFCHTVANERGTKEMPGEEARSQVESPYHEAEENKTCNMGIQFSPATSEKRMPESQVEYRNSEILSDLILPRFDYDMECNPPAMDTLAPAPCEMSYGVGPLDLDMSSLPIPEVDELRIPISTSEPTLAQPPSAMFVPMPGASLKTTSIGLVSAKPCSFVDKDTADSSNGSLCSQASMDLRDIARHPSVHESDQAILALGDDESPPRSIPASSAGRLRMSM